MESRSFLFVKGRPSLADQTRSRLEDHSAGIVVVGLGYVGLPVAAAFAEAGFHVVGIDLDLAKVQAVGEGRSYIGDVPDSVLQRLVSSGRLSASAEFTPVADADVVVISVPTPLHEGAPDLSKVIAAGEAVGETMRDGTLVILESTTYPGTTEELLAPLLEREGRTVGRDFFLAYSPERIDPGNEKFPFSEIPKVVGGHDEVSTDLAALLYEQVVAKVVRVSGTREAEFSKLIENTFRHVNIALVNELAIYSFEMGIDIWEAIEAAATKPFGFQPFWPSPGWGGHCIPLDPAYLSWRVRKDRAHEVRFVELAQAVNSEMPRHVVERVSLLLNEHGKAIRGSKILGIGVAYKAGTEDVRESAGLKILGRLMKLGAEVAYVDPLVPTAMVGGDRLVSASLDREMLAVQDLVIIFTAQEDVDWHLVKSDAPLILDCCNALKAKGGRISRL